MKGDRPLSWDKRGLAPVKGQWLEILLVLFARKGLLQFVRRHDWRRGHFAARRLGRDHMRHHNAATREGHYFGTSDIGRSTIGFATFRLDGLCHYSFSHMLHLGQVMAGVFCCPLSAMHGAGPASTFT